MADKATVAVRLVAPRDRNGNPRRGWLVLDENGNVIRFLDEGYVGPSILKSAGFDEVSQGPEIKVSARVHQEWCRADSRGHWTRERVEE